MENEQNIQPGPDPFEQEPEKKEYRPRPGWQVWAARIGLVIMIISIILYYIHIATGGLG